MSSFFLALFIATTSGILFCCIIDVPSIGLGTLEAEVRALVPVGVTVVDDQTIPCSGCTTPRSLSICPTPGSVLSPILGTSIMQQKSIPEAVTIKNTRRNDDIRRLIIAKI